MTRAFNVPGEPRGKGRPRFSKGHAYTDSETKAYERKIAVYYKKAHGGFSFPESASLYVGVTAYYRIPKRATKAATEAMEARTVQPHRKPDIDNVLKGVLDALNGVAYKDDSSVVAVCGRKEFSHEPRLEIVIKEL